MTMRLIRLPCRLPSKLGTLQCESKNPPWGFLAFFPKWLGIFRLNFTCLLYIAIYAILQIFVQLSATLTKLCHIKRDHPVHIIMRKMFTYRPKRMLAFSAISPKQLGIFSPNFTRLLHDPIYAGTQIFTQLSPTLMKLCHFKCDHLACVSADGAHFENMMVVALNMA